MKRETFWIVWNPLGNRPTYKHDILRDAQEEARRLAKSQPGQEFIVLQAIGGYVIRDPVAEIEFDEIPF